MQKFALSATPMQIYIPPEKSTPIPGQENHNELQYKQPQKDKARGCFKFFCRKTTVIYHHIEFSNISHALLNQPQSLETSTTKLYRETGLQHILDMQMTNIYKRWIPS